MKRRDFLSQAAACTAAMALGPLAVPARPVSALRLTLLHTNDVHSWLEPMDSGDHAGLGGAPARAALIADARRQFPNSLVLDAGDLFQGTPYFNLFQGEPEIVCMNEMGYDASAIGNHDFDAGIERLAELVRGRAHFPFVSANYDFTNTPMQGLSADSIIRDFEGARIGIVGAGIELEGLVTKSLYGETQYLPPVSTIRRVAQRLRWDQKCDFVICLSHASLETDERFAKEIPELDLVIGGHNHILLRAPKQFLRDNGICYVNQVGWAGTHLGVLHFDIYDSQRRELAAAATPRIGAVA